MCTLHMSLLALACGPFSQLTTGFVHGQYFYGNSLQKGKRMREGKRDYWPILCEGKTPRARKYLLYYE